MKFISTGPFLFPSGSVWWRSLINEWWCRRYNCLPSAGRPALVGKPPRCPRCHWGPAVSCPTSPQGCTVSETQKTITLLLQIDLRFYHWITQQERLCYFSLKLQPKKCYLIWRVCIFFFFLFFCLVFFHTLNWGNFLKTFQITDDSQKKDELGKFLYFFFSFFLDFVGKY